MTRTNAKAILVALALAGDLTACNTTAGDQSRAAGDAGENASATVAQSAAMRSAAYSVSNPTNGGPAYVGGIRR
jgi:hypothetical protein